MRQMLSNVCDGWDDDTFEEDEQVIVLKERRCLYDAATVVCWCCGLYGWFAAGRVRELFRAGAG
jgi:hypothetical protein